MKITRVEAITFEKDLKIGGGSGGADGAEFWWVRLSTDSGLQGIGETYPFQGAEVGASRDIGDELLGRDPRDIDGIWRDLYHRMTMRNAGGAEMRVLSAINMAQMDILGQASGLPLYRLIGGKTRSRVKVYNTTTDYWAINETRMGPDTKKIVDFLLDRGITAMKIYPFRGRGDYISNNELERGLKWIRDIRDHAGQRMDVCVDCWGRWNLPSAVKIANSLEPLNVLYLEDVMVPCNAQSYAQLVRETSVPICISETLASRYEYREFLEAKACDVVMYDLSWVGGISEARRISDMASAYFIPTSPHTCGGPLLYCCSCHVSSALPDFLIMESNYWKYTHQYPFFINNVPVPEEGFVRPPENPGIGAEIRPELFSDGHANIETIAEF
jgi:L-alanine-DL-glutamate epimerase-like enolase superfamily enzyme